MKRVFKTIATIAKTKKALPKSGLLSPLTLAAIAALTVGSLLSGCGPTVRTDTGTTTTGDPGTITGGGTISINANNSATFTVTGNTGSFTFPNSKSISSTSSSCPVANTICGADSALKVQLTPGTLQNIVPPTGTSYSAWAPNFSCVGFSVQLIKVSGNGATTNVGGPVLASPMRQGAGSAFCDAQAGSLNMTSAPSSIIVNFNQSSLDSTAAGYRIQVSGAVNDYKYQSCLLGCTYDSWNCDGWDPLNYNWSNYGQPGTLRCQRYGLGPVYQTHNVQGQIAIGLNNQ